MTGSQWQTLNLKPGDKIRNVSQHNVNGLEVVVPSESGRAMIASRDGYWISASNGNGKIYVTQRSYGYGDPNIYVKE